MEPAAEKFQQIIDQIEIKDPAIPIISNVTNELLVNKDAFKKEMIDQLSSPVLWEQNVRKLLELGVTTFIECGPGKVLAGLIKKINREATVHCVFDEATLKQAVVSLKGGNTVELS